MTTQMNLKNTTLSVVSQKRQIPYDLALRHRGQAGEVAGWDSEVQSVLTQQSRGREVQRREGSQEHSDNYVRRQVGARRAGMITREVIEMSHHAVVHLQQAC